MTEDEKKFFLEGDQGLRPYLRSDGMPQNKVRQIAWLLLNGGGCAFCKVCRDEPCNIEDGASCTDNIAKYIRKIVAEEKLDPEEQAKQAEQIKQPWQTGQIEKTLVGYAAGQGGDSEHAIYTCGLRNGVTLHRYTDEQGATRSAIYSAQNQEIIRCRRRFEHDMIVYWSQVQER